MKYNEKKIPYYSFEHIDDTGVAVTAFTGKLADGIRLYWREGEALSDITENNEHFLSQFGTDLSHLVTVHQMHTDHIHIVKEEDLGCSLLRNQLLDMDGLISNIAGSVLVIDVADCTPLFFADPVKKVIGLAHAGRKGTQMHIDRKIIETMVSKFGSDPHHIKVGIGPSIGFDCYEVGDDVAQEFWEAWSKTMKKPEMDPVMRRKGEKYHIDLWEANRLSLIDAGVLPENIRVSGICTCENVKDFYSFRGDGSIINENAAYIMLK